MAFPAAIAGVGAGAGVLGGLTQAFGSLFSGQAQAAQMQYQAGVAQVNAQVADQNATYATQAGEVEAQQSGMQGRQVVGETKAGFGAGNIDVSTGSGKNVISSETEVTQQNQGIIRANAAKRAYGFEVGAAEDVAQAGAYGVAAQTSQTAGEIGAVSSILGAAGSVSSKWLQASQSFSTTPANINPDSSAGQAAYSSSIFSG